MDVTAENLANAQTTRTASGGPISARRSSSSRSDGFGATLAGAIGSASRLAGGVEVAGIVNDPTPDKLVYDPGHPDANAQGYVRMPNVNPVTEMVDLISESRSYEAECDRDADRQDDVLQDAGSAQVIPPISGAIGPLGPGRVEHLADHGLGADARSRHRRDGATGATGRARQLRRRAVERDQLARADADDATTAAQQLATGKATDPTQAVTAVENASLDDAARLAAPHQARRRRDHDLPDPGVSECPWPVNRHQAVDRAAGR